MWETTLQVLSWEDQLFWNVRLTIFDPSLTPFTEGRYTWSMCLTSRVAWLALIVVAASCFRTAEGGCGGPVVGEPCRCDEGNRQGIVPPMTKRPPDEGTPEPGGTVIIHADAEPPHLMCLLRPDAWCARIALHDVYEALLRRDPFTHELLPELAEFYERSDDGLELTFHLRPDVTWHDGRSFSSADVLFTFNTIRDPAILAPTARANLETIESYEAIDSLTVRVKLKQPSYYLLDHLEAIPIIPEHLFGRGDFNTHPRLRHPVGTGPFRVTAFRAGREIVLERFADYWGPLAHLDRIIYRFAPDRTVALQMLQRGDIDIMARLTPAQLEQVNHTPQLLRTHRPQTHLAQGYSFVVYNTRRPQFRDHRVRRALSLLIDRPTFLCALEDCLGGLQNGPFPEGHPGVDRSLPPRTFDPARAEALLDEAGWRRAGIGNVRQKDPWQLRFTLLVPTVSTSLQRMATLLQHDLHQAGIDLDLYAVDWALFMERLTDHDFDAAVLQFSLDWETDYYLLYHSSQAEGGMNYGRWEHDEADGIMSRLRVELDPPQRRLLLQRLHRILDHEQPHTYLMTRVVTTVVPRSMGHVHLGQPWYDERTWYIPARFRTSEGRPRR